KEVIDPKIGGQRDVWDFVATAAGAAVVLPKLVWPFLLSFLQAGWALSGG
ncbi:MAG: hypothetical protein JKX71_07530, partial [Amylibacter sp.]|nr:hypothetical protein [Amylibacter sp.]